MAAEKEQTKKIKLGFRQTFFMVLNYARKRVMEQIKAVAVIIIYLILFQIIVLGIPIAEASIIASGLILVIAGLTFFMEGLLLGLMPLGEVIGIQLPQKSKLPVIIIFSFILGVGATFAEPAIGVLKLAGSSVKAWEAPLLFLMLNKYSHILVYSVGMGVGIAVIFGMLRYLYGWSLKPFIYILIGLLTLLSLYAHFNPNLYYLLGLAWDCGAVTTGPVTVPLVLALGIGISRIAGGSSEGGASGFGAVTLASLFPIIAVLTIGIISMSSITTPLSAEDFAKKHKDEKVLNLFNSQDACMGYLLMNTSPDVYMHAFDKNENNLVDYIRKVKNDPKQCALVFGSADKGLEMWALGNSSPLLMDLVFGTEKNMEDFRKSHGSLNTIAPLNSMDVLVRNSKAAFQAIIPLVLFLLLVLFFVIRDKLPQPDEVLLGIAFALVGMGIFNIGIELGLSKLGNQVGKNLPSSFSAIELVEEAQVISNFDQDLVNSSISEKGEKTEFFYSKKSKDIEIVPFHADNYNEENKSYVHVPVRGPLFGSEGGIAGMLVIILFAFVMGYGATLAEPALNALGLTVEEITVGTFPKSVLMQAVAIGVGVGISLGVAKIIWNIPLFWLLIPPYLLLLLITRFSTEEYVNIGWDSAGVTTGPITVPLVLAMGLGIGGQVGVVEGFGILSMASVCPIISVLSIGLIVNHRRKKVLKEIEKNKA
jgi:hypothetical protein